jgi:hypothetical protein
MSWVILGILVALFLGLELWALCRASANREAAWVKAAGEDQVVG